MKSPRRYRDIVSRITPLQLTQPDDLAELTYNEVFTDFTSGRRTSLFLGHYSKRGIRFALDTLGVLSQLKEIGLGNISAAIDTSNPFSHAFRLYHTEIGRCKKNFEFAINKNSCGLDYGGQKAR